MIVIKNQDGSFSAAHRAKDGVMCVSEHKVSFQAWANCWVMVNARGKK